MMETVVKEYITEPADMQAYKESAYYQSLGIEPLQEMLKQYTKDDAALRAQAEAQYRPTYESEMEAIRQQRDAQALGYKQQLDALAPAYDRQRRRANQAYDESVVSLNNALTKRGMGRSSLVSTQGAYLENQRNQALADIDREEMDDIQAINERIALLTSQAAESQKSLARNYAQQLESRISSLREQNQSAALSLQLQIAALQQKGYEAYQKWLLDNRKVVLDEKEYDAEYAPVVSSGSSGKSSKTSSSSGKKKTSEVVKAANQVSSVISSALNKLKGTATVGSVSGVIRPGKSSVQKKG